MKRPSGRALAAAVCVLLAGCIPLHAEARFAFDLDVTCDDAELRALTRGFFSRSLREIKDVRVGESATPSYRVKVVARPDGHGWAMSVVITEELDSAQLVATGSGDSSDYGRILLHWLGTGSGPNRLDEEITQVVKSFDREVLKPLRKAAKGKK